MLDGFVATICPVCEKPLLAVDNGHVMFHVECAKTARKFAFSGHKYKAR